MKFFKEADKAAVKTIDAGVKNKWSWKWQQEVLCLDLDIKNSLSRGWTPDKRSFQQLSWLNL